ncbi:hypothetical protein AB0A71_29820 [Kitasatospora aureofaciens]|uniref:hypothetical protein n=1 Tax=Kitasatospora aureofaciens TaxID=1894 RepID=UPI0033F5DF8E
MDEVALHVQDEENNLFPRLRQACAAEQRADLGDKIRRAKAMAPTRPHPAAPSTPTASNLASAAGLVDRARGFVTLTWSAQSRTTTTASGACLPIGPGRSPDSGGWGCSPDRP